MKACRVVLCVQNSKERKNRSWRTMPPRHLVTSSTTTFALCSTTEQRRITSSWYTTTSITAEHHHAKKYRTYTLHCREIRMPNRMHHSQNNAPVQACPAMDSVRGLFVHCNAVSRLTPFRGPSRLYFVGWVAVGVSANSSRCSTSNTKTSKHTTYILPTYLRVHPAIWTVSLFGGASIRS